jgi:WD40 repeat protein
VLFSKFSFDGKDLVTGHRDGAVLRWDASSFRKIGVAIRHTRSLSAMRQCGDGHRWIVADDTGRAYIRDLSRDNAVAILGSRGCPVSAVRFDRQDRVVIADLRTCRVTPARQERWDVRSRRIVTPAPGGDPPGTTPQAASSEDFDARQIVASVLKLKEKSLPGLFLETAIDGRHVGLIGRADGGQRTATQDSSAGGSLEEAALTALTPDGAPNAIAVSPAGDRWVITGLDGTFEVFDVTARRTHQRFGHIGALRSAVFSPDGTTIATTGDDGTARLWDAETGATLAVFTGHDGPVLSASFSHDGEQLATAGADGTIRIYPVRPAGILALACSRLRGTPAWSRVSTRCPWE